MKGKRIFSLVFIIIFILGFSEHAKCNQQIVWTQPEGLYGGEINSITFSPDFSIDKTIFAGGPEGLYVSIDRGSTWKRVTFGFSEGINSISLSPSYGKDRTIIVGTKDGIYASNDSGNTWYTFQRGVLNTYIIEVKSDSNGNYYALSFDGALMKKMPSDQTWKLIGTFDNPLSNTFTVSNNTIYIGCEEGSIYELSLQTNEKNLIAKNLCEGTISSIDIYGSTIYASSYDGGVFVSVGGKNFSQELKGSKISDLQISENGVLFALSSFNGLEIKTSAGWEDFDINYDSTNLSLQLAPDFTSSRLLLVGSREYGIIESNDAGKTFSISNNGITNLNVTAVAFSKNYASDKTIYLGTYSNGLYISKDEGSSFSHLKNFDPSISINSIEQLSNGTLLIGTAGNGIYYSTDGNTFTQLGLIANDFINFIKQTPSGKIFVGTEDDGLYYMASDTSNVTKITNGIYSWDKNINNIASSDNNIFLSTNGGNLYLSADGGNTFKEIGKNSFGGLSITGMSISPSFSNDGTILIGTSGGVYISNDYGNHFINIPDLLGTWADGCAISPDYANDGFTAIGAWGHVYITGNKGKSYQDIYSNVTNRYITKIALTPDFKYMKSGSIFILTNSGGLFRLKQKNEITLKMTIDQKGMLVNEQFVDTDVAPIILNNRTLVPVRFISEAFGADVQWYAGSRKVVIKLNNINIEMFIGKPQAHINGKEITIDQQNEKVTPVIISNRTFVPIRFISEAFGAQVEWNADLRQVTITLEG